jgi:Na+-transporting methylmalonyl-CoA/oxaloacetate decarboxylase gamma subunit
MKLSTLLLVESSQRVAGKSAEEFARLDPSGIAMVIIAMTIVFTVLITLFLAFKYISKLYKINFRKYLQKSQPVIHASDQPNEISGETLAAIALALHLYQKELQGMDDAVITIKNEAKKYSPWSSKIYGLRKTPNQ